MEKSFKKQIPKAIFSGKNAVILAILLYLLLALFNIDYPGLNTDEAFNGVVSNNIFRDASDIGRGEAPFLSCRVVLFGKIFPVMSSEYYGPVIPYLIHPFIRIFGPRAISLRLASVFILSIFLPFVYLLCKTWFGRRVGFLAMLFTAVNLVFVQYSRVGLYRCEIFVMLFFWMGLFFLVKYAQNKKDYLIFLSFIFFGLSFSTKITFLYYFAGFILAYLIIGRKLGLFGLFNIKKVTIAFSSFCLGSFFIIAYNIKEPWISIRQLSAALVDPYSTGNYTVGLAANNLDYLGNLGIRLSNLFTLLKGDISDHVYQGVIRASVMENISPLVLIFMIMSLIAVLSLGLFSSTLHKIVRRRILFLCIIYWAVFFLSPLTLSSFNQGHLLVLLPFPQVAVALFLDYLWNAAERRKAVIMKITGWFLATSVVLFNIWTNLYFNSQMKKTGGYGRWSSAITELTDYLQNNNIVSPVMFGYGLHANLIFLTNDKIKPAIYDKFYPQPVALAYKKLFSSNMPIYYLTFVPEKGDLENFFMMRRNAEKEAIPDNNNIDALFVELPCDESMNYRDLFMKYAKDFGKKVELERVFLNRADQPVYWLYKIQ